jgi:bacterioferritin
MDFPGYQMDIAYPDVAGIRPNKAQAMMLMEGYCGAVSELSTVTQYAYHHIRCGRYDEIAQTIKGIFFVEALHMELLGKCIARLGVDPRYFTYSKQGQSFWHAGVVNYEESVRDMLWADIEGEKGAVDFYLITAERIGNPVVANLLLRLAEDEKLHVRMFTDLYSKYFDRT